MNEDKNRTRICLLLDFYGEILTRPVADALDLYYNDDLSYSEIAENLGISRQGVRDNLVRGAELLNHYESVLHLAQRFRENCEIREKLLLSLHAADLSDEKKAELTELIQSLIF